MSASDLWVQLLTWPMVGLTYLFLSWTIWQFHLGRRSLEYVVVVLLLAIAVTLYLVRPLGALGLLDTGSETPAFIGLSLRVIYLVFIGGLAFSIIDAWRDGRHEK